MKKNTKPHETKKKTIIPKKKIQEAPEVVQTQQTTIVPRRHLVDSETGEIFALPLFKTPYNAKLFTSKTKEPGGGKSLTIPDQALTVPQIIKRSQAGMPLHVGYKQAYYEGEEGDLPDLRKLDLAELQKLREEATIRVEQIKYELNKQHYDKQEEQRKAREEKLKAEIKAQLEEQAQGSQQRSK